MKLSIFILLFISGVSVAQNETEDPKPIWEPNLPNGQRFVALLRSIKSYRLVKYDIAYSGERYPVTELCCELTHGSARFLAVESSAEKKQPLSLSEIAEGKHMDQTYSKTIPGQESPAKMKNRTLPSTNQIQFLMPSPSEVEKLYRQLDTSFRVSFPW